MQNVSIQLSLFDAIKDLLLVKPIFLLGVLVLGVVLGVLFRKDQTMPQRTKVRISVVSLLFYYYLAVMLTHIVGIPTLSEFMRLSRLGESFFHPNLNLIPFSDGVSLSFLLNIALFVPLGFLCPLLSKRYQSLKNILLLGGGLSVAIELVQLFTLYRATDVDDLITNLAGALLGYACFWVMRKLVTRKSPASHDFEEPKRLWCVPVVMIATTFVLGFFS